MQVSRKQFVMVKRYDDNADASYLGEYTDTPGPDDKTIDRRENRERGTYRYFVAAMSGEESGNPDSVKQDYARMKAINNGDVCFYGVSATVRVDIPGRAYQTFDSGGVWGIESDSGEDYFREVFEQQCAELEAILRALGIEVVD